MPSPLPFAVLAGLQALSASDYDCHAYSQDGQALVRHGESGTNFFVIRYGKVRVMRPLADGTMMEVCVLRRGQMVGERTLITGAVAR